MPKFVTRAVLLSIVWAAAQAAGPQAIAPQAAWGADHEFPVINSIGRFFGVGYTRGGYHAAQDGRLNAITNRHPAADYRPGGLPQYSQPQYSPPRSAVGSGPSPVLAPAPSGTTSGKSGSAAVSPSNMSPKNESAAPQSDASAKPAAPAKPSQPPPRWLEEYLQQSEAAKAHELPLPQVPPPKDAAPQASPSDRLLDESSTDLDTGLEVGFSIIDSGFPTPVYQAPISSNAAEFSNRYR